MFHFNSDNFISQSRKKIHKFQITKLDDGVFIRNQIDYLNNYSFFLCNVLPTKNWHLPSASTRTKSLVTAATDLQHPPLKELRVKFRNEASVLWEKLAEYTFR